MQWCLFLAEFPQGKGYKNKGVHERTTLFCRVKVRQTCKEVLNVLFGVQHREAHVVCLLFTADLNSSLNKSLTLLGKARKWLVPYKNLHSSGSTVLQIKKAVLCALQQRDNLFIIALKWISARSISHRRRIWPLHHLQAVSCCWPCGMGPLERDAFGHRCLVFRQSLPLCRREALSLLRSRECRALNPVHASKAV